jgi:hypothetical protein
MPDELPKTMSIPEAGARYFGLSRNGSYDAARRKEIPFITIGRLKRVPVQLMERMMEEPSAAKPREKASAELIPNTTA